jgi:hypothetical protein
MKNVLIISLLTVMLAVSFANAYTVEERIFDGATPARTEWDSGVSGSDTLQAQHPDHMIVEQFVWDGGWTPHQGPMWGNVTTYDAITDAGSDWWDYGPVPTTIGEQGVGDGYIDLTFDNAYAGEWGEQFDGWTLDNITILVGEQGPHPSVNYHFQIAVRDKTTWAWTYLDMDLDTAGTQVDLIGGSDQAGYGTKIVIDNIDMDNIRGVRVLSKGLEQSDDNWAPALINEVDVQMTPEPATIAILGLGGLFLRRRNK